MNRLTLTSDHVIRNLTLRELLNAVREELPNGATLAEVLERKYEVTFEAHMEEAASTIKELESQLITQIAKQHKEITEELRNSGKLLYEYGEKLALKLEEKSIDRQVEVLKKKLANAEHTISQLRGILSIDSPVELKGSNGSSLEVPYRN